MAIFSSHLLNSLDGTHANNVKVTIFQINLKGERKIFFDTKTDENGRILKEFDLTNNDLNCDYEMNIEIRDYFLKEYKIETIKIVNEILVKFKMLENNKKYHIPIIVSPNSYSVWWSK